MNDSQALRDAAALAANSAYAPYSGLHVGAALRSERGKVYCGCNVENASLSIGGCAERAAIASAVLAEGGGFRLADIAVVAFRDGSTPLPVSPCGACRQALVEFGPNARVGFLSSDHCWTLTTAAALLPGGFTLPAR